MAYATDTISCSPMFVSASVEQTLVVHLGMCLILRTLSVVYLGSCFPRLLVS